MRLRPRRRILTGRQFAARFKAEKALLQRRYCDAFGLWRTCTHKRCRRERGCCGDQNACLARAIGIVPRDTRWRLRQDILLFGTPNNIGAPERAARQCMPEDFYADAVAQAVARYLARFKPQRRAKA